MAMELIQVNNKPTTMVERTELVQEYSSAEFMAANTKAVTRDTIKSKCIIPVFARDNESTVSHAEFIDVVGEAVNHHYYAEKVLRPAVRVSHPVRGRIPEAMGKPVQQLLESEKTLFYERMAFVIDIPTIRDTVNGNDLCLTVGGVRAYNTENLYGKKTEEKFKVFVGFSNRVCLNLCISTDGFAKEIKARTLDELYTHVLQLISEFNAMEFVNHLHKLNQFSITEKQFALMVGRARMYQYLPLRAKKDIVSLDLGDSQINMVVKDYYGDESFSRDRLGDINLWNLYNLFTQSNKSSYIDTFLDRGLSAQNFCTEIMRSITTNKEFWYLS